MKDDKLEESVNELIIDICEVLYDHGYRTVPIGAVMRLIGVDATKAAEHDDELFRLDEEFEALIKDKKPKIPEAPIVIPPGATIH